MNFDIKHAGFPKIGVPLVTSSHPSFDLYVFPWNQPSSSVFGVPPHDKTHRQNHRFCPHFFRSIEVPGRAAPRWPVRCPPGRQRSGGEIRCVWPPKRSGSTVTNVEMYIYKIIRNIYSCETSSIGVYIYIYIMLICWYLYYLYIFKYPIYIKLYIYMW